MPEYSCSIHKFNSEIQLKISNEQLELNLRMTKAESIDLIENIQKAKWDERKSIRAGSCLDSNVFWCINENKSISLLIGHDDETWEIAIVIPIDIMDEIKIKTGYNNGYK
ncbi:MAG: hypothetical protein ACK5MD_03280 [Flavobacteriales bacterium]